MKLANTTKAALMGAVLASSSAFAGLQTGDGELGAFFYMIDDDTTTTTAIQSNFGYMFTDSIQGQFRFGISGSDSDFGGDQTTTNLGFGANYLFGDANSDVVPYVGLGFDTYEPSTGDGFDYTTITVGAKFFLNETTSFDIRMDNQSGDNDAEQTIILAGINVYF